MRLSETRRLTEGLACWLHYEFCCSRGYLFDESYLRVAVGNILVSKYGAATAKILKSHPHPALACLKDGTSGRKKELDFCVQAYDRQTILAIETKWAGSSHCKAATVILDIVRIETVIASATGAEGIFVCAGPHKKIEALFAGLNFDSGKCMIPVDENRLGEKTINLVPSEHHVRKAMSGIFREIQNARIPRKIRLELYPPLLQQTGSVKLGVYGWRVKPTGRRETFVPRDVPEYRV